MKTILVIGAGRSSSSMIRYFLNNAEKEDWYIRVGDMNLEMAQDKVGEHSRAEAFQFDALNKEMIGLKQFVTMDTEDRATELALIRQQLQDQTDTLETLRRELGVMKKQLSEAKEDIRSNLEYRARHNGEVLEMKKQIQRLGDLPTTPTS